MIMLGKNCYYSKSKRTKSATTFNYKLSRWNGSKRKPLSVNANSNSEVTFGKAKETYTACCRKTSQPPTHTHSSTRQKFLSKNVFPLHLSFDAVVIFLCLWRVYCSSTQTTLNLHIYIRNSLSRSYTRLTFINWRHLPKRHHSRSHRKFTRPSSGFYRSQETNNDVETGQIF